MQFCEIYVLVHLDKHTGVGVWFICRLKLHMEDIFKQRRSPNKMKRRNTRNSREAIHFISKIKHLWSCASIDEEARPPGVILLFEKKIILNSH